MDIGFEQAGFKVCWTNEINQEIADLHEHGMTSMHWANKGPTHPMVRISSRKSIVDLSAPEVLRQARPGKIFGVIGGPPCPDFSIAGKQKGREGDRGKLSRCYVDMILALKPTFFVFENVPGLVTTRKHFEYFQELRSILRDGGYLTDYKVLSALNYGIPQDRNRLFMVGFREKDLIQKPPGVPTLVEVYGKQLYEDGWFPFPRESYPNAKTFYQWPGKGPFGETPESTNAPFELTVNCLLHGAETQNNGMEYFVPKTDKFGQIEEGDVDRKSCKRLHRFRYSPTACYGNNEVHFHPWLPRRLSVREALRIQTVPDTYVLPSDAPLSAKFKMIGNGVPCRLANILAREIKKYLEANIKSVRDARYVGV